MERWHRWLVIAAAVAAPVRDLQAEAVTLSFQLVAHPVEVHTIEVPGQPGRVVGIASFRGIAIFDDGRIAHHSYAGTFDFLNGAGAIRGYARWTFDDGSHTIAEAQAVLR